MQVGYSILFPLQSVHAPSESQLFYPHLKPQSHVGGLILSPLHVIHVVGALIQVEHGLVHS